MEAAEEEIRAKGRRAMAVTADVTRQDQVTESVEAALARFGKIDILVNNAGINIRKPALDKRRTISSKSLTSSLGWWIRSRLSWRRAGPLLMSWRSASCGPGARLPKRSAKAARLRMKWKTS